MMIGGAGTDNQRHSYPEVAGKWPSWLVAFIILCAWSGSVAGRGMEYQLMGTESASEISQLLGPLLRARGFVDRGLRWYRYEEESILLIDVQPARYSPGSYINLGVYYYKYGKADLPSIVECHLDTRLTSIVPDPLRGDELLDTSNDIPRDLRREELQAMIRSYGIPWLQKLARFDDAKIVLANSPKAAHVAPTVRADLITPQKSTGR